MAMLVSEACALVLQIQIWVVKGASAKGGGSDALTADPYLIL